MPTPPIKKFKLGTVLKVYDGDTITVLYRKQEYTLRICQIDAPELRQPFGPESRDALSLLLLNQKVYFYLMTKDKYGRYVSEIKFNRKLIHRWLISEGLAQVYSLYCTDKYLYKLETKAKKLKKGLWIQDAIEAPWVFRRRIKEKNEQP